MNKITYCCRVLSVLSAMVFFNTAFAGSPVKVGVLLPLHEDNGDGVRMVEYFRGMLFAIDSLKQEGISVDLVAHNVREDANVDSVLQLGDMADRDIIFGPLYSKQVPAISMLSKLKGTKLVIPFSIDTPELQNCQNLVQVYQSQTDMEPMTIKNFMRLAFKDADNQVVIVDCNDTTSFKKPTFTANLKKYCEANKISYRITNSLQTDKAFLKAFNKKKDNIVVLNSASSPKMLEVFTKLNMVREKNPKIKFKILGYTEWLMYEKFQADNFCKNDVYIPSKFYYNAGNQEVMNLEKKYMFWFRQNPQYSLPKFLITGFDQGYYFIKGMVKYGKAFVGSPSQPVNTALQSPMHFSKVSEKGGYINDDVMFIHYRSDKARELINY